MSASQPEHAHTTHVQRVHADCALWRSGQCHGDKKCRCLPPLNIPTNKDDKRNRDNK